MPNHPPAISDQALQDLLNTGVAFSLKDLREQMVELVQQRMAIDCEVLRVQADHLQVLQEIRAGQAEIRDLLRRVA